MTGARGRDPRHSLGGDDVLGGPQVFRLRPDLVSGDVGELVAAVAARDPASGDRALALRHARIYTRLVGPELDTPAYVELAAYAARLRTSSRAPGQSFGITPSGDASSPIQVPVVDPDRHRLIGTRARAGAIGMAVVAMVWIASHVLGASNATATAIAAPSGPLVAIGRVDAYGDSTARRDAARRHAVDEPRPRLRHPRRQRGSHL